MKNLGQSVIDTVASSYSGTFPGGVSRTLTAKEIGIQLPMASSRFTRFTQADYADLFKKLADGTITVKDNTAASSADRLGTGKVKVEVIN
jgi:basic membrane protein A